MGTFAFGSIAETSEARLKNPDNRPGMNVYHDVCDLYFPPDLSHEDISEGALNLIRKYDPNKGKCQAAMVVDDGFAYAIVHQFIVVGKLNRTPIERSVFRNEDGAKKWLGLPENYEINFHDLVEIA